MAIRDYGAIVFKNGKLISTDMFTPMMDMVGWEDTPEDTYHDWRTEKDYPLKLKGNYFAYIGDKENTIAFYKTNIRTVDYVNDKFYNEYIGFDYNGFTWLKWQKWFGGEEIKVTKRNGYYVCRWKYKGDKYKVYFGYGVDLGYYKKYRIVNYYRSPEYIIKCMVYRLKKDFKW